MEPGGPELDHKPIDGGRAWGFLQLDPCFCVPGSGCVTVNADSMREIFLTDALCDYRWQI